MQGWRRVASKIQDYLPLRQAIGMAIVLSACATSGPVSTTQSDAVFEIRSEPSGFVSPLRQIEIARRGASESDFATHRQMHYTENQWLHYASWAQAWDEREAEQARIEQELAETGEVILLPGQSYSFDLESYCVHGGEVQPVTGDELTVAPLQGKAENWLPTILDAQGKLHIPHAQVQYLIWALLHDIRFDELSDENQRTLLQFFPDAALRFGNRGLEEIGKNLLQTALPLGIVDTVSQLAEYRERILELNSDFRSLEQILAPKSDRKKPNPVGWMKMPEGFLMRLISQDYSQIRVDIFVPPEAPSEKSRQTIKKKKVFRPSRWVALPASGQRLAISPVAVPRPKRDQKNACETNRAYRPNTCHLMTEQDRRKILLLSDPKLFSYTRYEQKSGGNTAIEEQSDCSSFVNTIYRRAGFKFPYSPTADFNCFSVFSSHPVAQHQPGDLILYPGHIGIMASDGQVISATEGGDYKISTLPRSDPRFRPAVRKLPINEVKKQLPLGVLKWRCP